MINKYMLLNAIQSDPKKADKFSRSEYEVLLSNLPSKPNNELLQHFEEAFLDVENLSDSETNKLVRAFLQINPTEAKAKRIFNKCLNVLEKSSNSQKIIKTALLKRALLKHTDYLIPYITISKDTKLRDKSPTLYFDLLASIDLNSTIDLVYNESSTIQKSFYKRIPSILKNHSSMLTEDDVHKLRVIFSKSSSADNFNALCAKLGLQFGKTRTKKIQEIRDFVSGLKLYQPINST